MIKKEDSINTMSKDFYKDEKAIQVGDIVEVVEYSDIHYIGLRGVVESIEDIRYPIRVNLGAYGVHSFSTKQLRPISYKELSNDDIQEELENTKRYRTASGKQLFDVLESDLLSTEEFRGFLKANIYKYLHRYQHKNGTEDLRKIKVYIDRLITLEDKHNEV